MIIVLKLKMEKVFGIWNTKYHLPKKVFVKVFTCKCPQINMYLVFYLNTSFWVFDPTLVAHICHVDTQTFLNVPKLSENNIWKRNVFRRWRNTGREGNGKELQTINSVTGEERWLAVDSLHRMKDQRWYYLSVNTDKNQLFDLRFVVCRF